jgi:hypothetical protein
MARRLIRGEPSSRRVARGRLTLGRGAVSRGRRSRVPFVGHTSSSRRGYASGTPADDRLRGVGPPRGSSVLVDGRVAPPHYDVGTPVRAQSGRAKAGRARRRRPESAAKRPHRLRASRSRSAENKLTGPATSNSVCLGSCRLPRPEARSMDFGLSAGILAAGPGPGSYSHLTKPPAKRDAQKPPVRFRRQPVPKRTIRLTLGGCA